MKANKAVAIITSLSLCGCVTARVEDARDATTGLNDGESVVVMVKSYHQGNETEANYLRCVENALARGSTKLNVIPNQQFVDQLFPWFEPRTAPDDTKGLEQLMERPGVTDAIDDMNVRPIRSDRVLRYRKETIATASPTLCRLWTGFLRSAESV